jgi:chemotaxis protein CheY-P-specific phosphatase CheC
MNQLLHDALVGGVENVFFQLTDLIPDLDGELTSETGGELLATCMEVGGTFPGTLHLAATRVVCGKVLGILLPGEMPSREMEQDVLCELLNMVAESARTLLAQGGASFDVGPPSPETISEDPDDTLRLSVPVLSETVYVWLIPGDQPRCQPARLNPELERMLGQ